MKGRPDSYLIILYPATNVKSTPQIDVVLIARQEAWKKRDVANRGCVAFKAAVMLYLAAQ
jgi:hypothetical protein